MSRPLSIRHRLLLLLSVPLALLLAAGALVDYLAVIPPLNDAYDHMLASAILAVSAHLDIDDRGTVKSELSDQAIAVLRADKDDDIYFLVLDGQGRFVAGDAGLPLAPPAPGNPAFFDTHYLGKPVRVATYRLTAAAGAGAISVAETTHKRTSATRRLLADTVAGGLAQLAITLLLVWLGVSAGLKPFLALRDQIARRSAQDLAPFDESGAPAEVRPLTLALNRLLCIVAEGARARHRFLADAAHQLRTPLAGLQAQLELLSSDPAIPSPAMRERLTSIRAGIKRLAHTASQLLALARAEPVANPIDDFRDLDLRLLAEDAVSVWFDHALDRRIDLGIEAQPAQVRGSAWLLRELLGNLIDNALTYAPLQGRVTVRCGRTAQHRAFLEVEDDGPGIAPAERERVLERFYRAPGSIADGSGLGLAIVDEIARAHNATLDIGSGEHARGTRVRIEFPAD